MSARVAKRPVSESLFTNERPSKRTEKVSVVPTLRKRKALDRDDKEDDPIQSALAAAAAAALSSPFTHGPLYDEPPVDEYMYDKPIRLVDHTVAMDRVAHWSKSTYQSYTRQLVELTQPKSKTYANPEHSRRGFDGDERLFNLRNDLKGFAEPPIELQMKMHEAAFSIEGPLIYGEEFFANKKLILEKNGWEPRLSVLFILTQRKMGKTYFLGQHATVHAMNPGKDELKIACISRTLDQAILTVAISRKLFNSHKRRQEFQLAINQVRRIVISRNGCESEIRAYRFLGYRCIDCWTTPWKRQEIDYTQEKLLAPKKKPFGKANI